MGKLHQLSAVAAFSLTLILSAPARANDASPERAVPGTLNYVEGSVSIRSQILNSKSIGSAELETGESLKTERGKAEILLTPGVFLRVGNNSSVKMMSSSLTDTEVGLNRGHAMIEVDEIHRENNIRISADGETTELLKTGLYDFDLRQHELRVFDGKARVLYAHDSHVDVKGGREVPLEGERVKARKFDKKSYNEGDLYRWSSLRSSYVAEANVNAASIYANSGWGPWAPVGGAPAGNGILGLTISLSFPATESFTVHSVGAFIHRGGCIRRLTMASMDTARAPTITSAPTIITGVRARTMWQVPPMPAVSIADLVRAAAFTPGLGLAASPDSAVFIPAEAVCGAPVLAEEV